jgi:hypothetical protein
MNGNVIAKVERALRKAAPWPGPVTNAGQQHPHQREILLAVCSFLGADGYGAGDVDIQNDLQLMLNISGGDHLES